MRVAIIGGGFCGFECAKLLKKECFVTLFDSKEYFEYTPSIHKVLTSPGYLSSINRQFRDSLKGVQVLPEKVVSLSNAVVVSKKHKIPFDYAVICSGVGYPIFLKNAQDVYTVKSGKECLECSSLLSQAGSVLVVGGGLIGVEVAAELAQKSNAKITLVHPFNRLIERNPENASAYAKKWLLGHNVEIVFEERVVDRTNDVFITDKGRKIRADLVFWCAGIKPEPSFYKGTKDEKGYVSVNEFLQTSSYPNMFCGGDACSVREEKTAQNALLHAKIIAKNIIRHSHGIALLSYKPSPKVMVISLGDYAGIFVYRGFVLTGWIPALLKKLIELRER
ncbi:FAD-dependent oxidoreductase [Candidatus Woesearchaeota archaeon]|nr:FAD-dependent oxidoreductase [Candidatus Woesearchaeota archaeon]